MTDPVDPFADIPSGWRAITAAMDSKLAWIAPAAEYTMVRVERGLLRVQVTPTSPEAERLLRDAEARAARTCEMCGGAGRAYMSVVGSVSTLCGDCSWD